MWRMHKLLYKWLLHGKYIYGEGRQEWEKACIECGLLLQKLKTPIKTRFASKVIMFEKTLEFKQAIITCYKRKKTIVL